MDVDVLDRVTAYLGQQTFWNLDAKRDSVGLTLLYMSRHVVFVDRTLYCHESMLTYASSSSCGGLTRVYVAVVAISSHVNTGEVRQIY